MGNPVVQASTSTGGLVELNDQRLCPFLKIDAISLSFSASSVLDVDFRKSPQSPKP